MSKIIKRTFPPVMDADVGGMAFSAADQIDRIAAQIRKIADQIDDPDIKRRIIDAVDQM